MAEVVSIGSHFIFIALIISNVALINYVDKIVFKEFISTGSVVKANKKKSFWEVVLFLVTLLLSVPIGLQISNLITLLSLRDYFYFLGSWFGYIYFGAMYLVWFSISHKTDMKINELESNRIDYVLWKLQMLALDLLPVMLMVLINSYILDHDNLPISQWLVSFSLVFILINIFSVHIHILILRAKLINKSELPDKVKGLIENLVRKCNIYEFNTMNNKYTNAYAFGGYLFNSKILISDNLKRVLTEKEFESVIAHELAHIKKHHKPVEGFVYLLAVSITQLLWSFMGEMDGYDFILALGMISLVFHLHSFMSRIHEKQADGYVIKIGCEPQIYISALQKVHSQNVFPATPLGKLEEKLSTHPSLENRIKYINEFAKSMGS